MVSSLLLKVMLFHSISNMLVTNNKIIVEIPTNNKYWVIVMIIKILGTPWTLKESNKTADPSLENCDGYCDETIKQIVVEKPPGKHIPGLKHDLNEYQKKVIRHEIIHAFLFESGLAESSWADNEEIVDWIASMFPKLKDVFENTNAM